MKSSAQLRKIIQWVLFVVVVLNPLSSFCQVQWVAWTGTAPANAVVGGNENGSDQYVCRASYNGSTHPGKVVGGNCNFGYGGKEILSRDFEILLNPGGILLSWESINANRIPQGAVVGGNENGNLRWVGQAMHVDGTIHSGKVLGTKETGFMCNYGYGGKEVSDHYTFKVLVARPDGQSAPQQQLTGFHREPAVVKTMPTRVHTQVQPQTETQIQTQGQPQEITSSSQQQTTIQENRFLLNNRWKTTEYINVPANGFAAVSNAVDVGSETAQWTQEPVSGEPFFRFRNLATNGYLHLEDGKVLCGAADLDRVGAQWSVEQQDGGSYFIIRNRWKPDQVLHNQYGKLSCGPIKANAWSAQWTFVPIAPTPVVEENQPADRNREDGGRMKHRWYNSGLPLQIQIIDGLSTNRSILSSNDDGGLVDLWSENVSGRQKWIVERVGNQESGYFHILVSGDVTGSRRYLSTNDDGTNVYLNTDDDGSGRQRWIIEPVSGVDPNIKTIRVAGGINGQRKYLSCFQDGTKVDLWINDDNSGRQRWYFRIL